jgi:hypothetical protein
LKRDQGISEFGAHLAGDVRQVAKVFWFFFSKKNILRHFLAPAANPP